MESVMFLFTVLAILSCSTLVLVGFAQLLMKSRRAVTKAGAAAAFLGVLLPTVTFIEPGYPAFGSLEFLLPLGVGLAMICLPLAYVFARLFERLAARQT